MFVVPLSSGALTIPSFVFWVGLIYILLSWFLSMAFGSFLLAPAQEYSQALGSNVDDITSKDAPGHAQTYASAPREAKAYDSECKDVTSHTHRFVKNKRQYIKYAVLFSASVFCLGEISGFLPLVAMGPAFLAGVISLPLMMQIIALFNTYVNSALSLAKQIKTLSNWWASATRLASLDACMTKIEKARETWLSASNAIGGSQGTELADDVVLSFDANGLQELLGCGQIAGGSSQDRLIKIKAGSCVQLSGNSGSGKSVLIRLLTGLLPHQLVEKSKDERLSSYVTYGNGVFDRILYVNQHWEMLPPNDEQTFEQLLTRWLPEDSHVRLSSSENEGLAQDAKHDKDLVQEAIDCLCGGNGKAKEKFSGWLNSGMPIAKKDFKGMSGGEKGLFALLRICVAVLKAKAEASKPKYPLVFLDEAFSAMDEGTATVAQQYVAQLFKKNGMTLVFVTHDQDKESERLKTPFNDRDDSRVQTINVNSLELKEKSATLRDATLSPSGFVQDRQVSPSRGYTNVVIFLATVSLSAVFFYQGWVEISLALFCAGVLLMLGNMASEQFRASIKKPPVGCAGKSDSFDSALKGRSLSLADGSCIARDRSSPPLGLTS